MRKSVQGSLSRSLISVLWLRRRETREGSHEGQTEREERGGGKFSENKLLPIQYSWIKSSLSFTRIFFPFCGNAAATLATSTGNRQLKLTRRNWLPAERYCQVEQASTEPAQTSWQQTGLISLAIVAALPTVAYNSSAAHQNFSTYLTKTIRIQNILKTTNGTEGGKTKAMATKQKLEVSSWW